MTEVKCIKCGKQASTVFNGNAYCKLHFVEAETSSRQMSDAIISVVEDAIKDVDRMYGKPSSRTPDGILERLKELEDEMYSLYRHPARTTEAERKERMDKIKAEIVSLCEELTEIAENDMEQREKAFRRLKQILGDKK